MVTAPLHESNLTGKPGRKTKVVQKCSHCSKGTGYPTVSPEDIPEVLRNLTENVLWALRPLEPDVGPVVKARHGYRVHTDMIRFWWRPQTVEEQLDMLEDEEECGHAWDAYQHLMADPESSYGRFVSMHQKFLRRNRAQVQADERRLQLPRRALEEEGLECAVWPHLYPKTAWCETHVRLQDVRRKESRHGRARSRRRTQPAAAAAARVPNTSSSSSTTSSDSDSSNSSASEETSAAAAARPQADEAEVEAAAEETEKESEDEEEDAAPLHFAREGRNSAKSSYLAKVLGPTLGYGSTYELFQFVYDLWLWSSLGAKKNTVDAPMRLAMAGVQLLPGVLAEPACWPRGFGSSTWIANALPDHCPVRVELAFSQVGRGRGGQAASGQVATAGSRNASHCARVGTDRGGVLDGCQQARQSCEREAMEQSPPRGKRWLWSKDCPQLLWQVGIPGRQAPTLCEPGGSSNAVLWYGSFAFAGLAATCGEHPVGEGRVSNGDGRQPCTSTTVRGHQKGSEPTCQICWTACIATLMSRHQMAVECS